MTEVNSAESYYQYRADADSKIKSMTEEISRLNDEIISSRLQGQIDRHVARIGGNEDVGNLIFKLTRSSAKETTDNGFSIGDLELSDAIESIRSNESLRSFFSSKPDIIPAPAPKREFKQSWDH
jgi:hypothetical protein